MGQTAQVTQGPVPQNITSNRASTRSDCVLATNPSTTPLPGRQKPQEVAGLAERLLEPEQVIVRSDCSGDPSTALETPPPQVGPTSVRELEVHINSWLPSSAPSDSCLETPFETPLSSGEPSPATPPSFPPAMSSLEQASVAVVNGEGRQTSAEKQAGPAAQSEVHSSRESEIDDWAPRTGSAPEEGLWEGRARKDSDLELEAVSSDNQISLHTAETTNPGLVESRLFRNLDAACCSSELARETSGESDVGTADDDSFQFQAPHASSSSSTDYGRHIGPPFGWANATPRFASQRSTPRARSQSFFPSPRKQGQLGRGAGPPLSGRSAPCSGPSSSVADLHKLSKTQLISML